MAEKNYGNNSQLAELVKYISDEMKFPIMGAGGGFAPIGTINFFDATTAPLGWLACDGSIHNISDYPDLATFYASQHGASNFYGGNGTTTFAVPNLQGEFLRGAGTNGHANQGNGGSVGQHQDATEHLNITGHLDNNANWATAPDAAKNRRFEHKNKDSERGSSPNGAWTGIGASGALGTTISQYYTSRPTNTSFLICVKATLSDTELNNMHVYSPNEHQVGWWQEMQSGVLKQKPVWEKTVNISSSITSGMTLATISSLENVKLFQGFFRTSNGYERSIGYNDISQYMLVYRDSNNIKTVFNGVFTSSQPITKISMVIQYTKTTDEWQTV